MNEYIIIALGFAVLIGYHLFKKRKQTPSHTGSGFLRRLKPVG